MNGILDAIFIGSVTIFSLAASCFVLAWIFVFPVIGFLWTMGWLQ